MGTYYTAACRPCRKTLEMYKLGAVLRSAVKNVDGEPVPVLTANAVRGATADDEEYMGERLGAAVAEWVEEHTAHAPVLFLHDGGSGGGIGLVYDDPIPWEETDIDTLCPQ